MACKWRPTYSPHVWQLLEPSLHFEKRRQSIVATPNRYVRNLRSPSLQEYCMLSVPAPFYLRLQWTALPTVSLFCNFFLVLVSCIRTYPLCVWLADPCQHGVNPELETFTTAQSADAGTHTRGTPHIPQCDWETANSSLQLRRLFAPTIPVLRYSVGVKLMP